MLYYCFVGKVFILSYMDCYSNCMLYSVIWLLCCYRGLYCTYLIYLVSSYNVYMLFVGFCAFLKLEVFYITLFCIDMLKFC